MEEITNKRLSEEKTDTPKNTIQQKPATVPGNAAGQDQIKTAKQTAQIARADGAAKQTAQIARPDGAAKQTAQIAKPTATVKQTAEGTAAKATETDGNIKQPAEDTAGQAVKAAAGKADQEAVQQEGAASASSTADQAAQLSGKEKEAAGSAEAAGSTAPAQAEDGLVEITVKAQEKKPDQTDQKQDKTRKKGKFSLRPGKRKNSSEEKTAPGAVQKVNWDEIEHKINDEKKKRKRRYLMILIIIAAAVALIIVSRYFRTYSKYHVISSEERQDTDATHFVTFNGNVVRYSNDGATCSDDLNNSLWSVSYEMSSPISAVRGSYLAIADEGGKTICLIDEDGLMDSITVDMPIVKIDVASDGTTAVLMEENSVCYLTVYKENGTKLASGEFHDSGSGYPMDMALSDDGENLAVVSLDISTGKSDSSIAFYNFGTAGMANEDSKVGEEVCEGTVIPDITYIDGSRLLAFGDNKVISFTGASKPKEDYTINIKNEIKAVFYNDSYFGLLMLQNGETSGNEIDVYNADGSSLNQIDTNRQFTSVEFLEDNEIALMNGQLCSIYTLKGHCKYQGKSESDFYTVLYTGRFRRFMFIRQGATEIVRLRGFRGDKN